MVAECQAVPARTAAACERGHQLAADVGGALAFAWRVLHLQYLIDHPPDDDSVRETYGELLDFYRNEPQQVATLRRIGQRIRFLEDSGALPSVLVLRAPRSHGPR